MSLNFLSMQELLLAGTPQACPVIAIIRDGKMLIGLRHYTPDKWKTVSVWTVPGGRCDDGEAIGVTLAREISEEVGMRNVVIERFLGTVPGAKEGDIVHVFVGRTDEEPVLMEPEKFSEWKWANLNEIPENFINARLLELIKTNSKD